MHRFDSHWAVEVRCHCLACGGMPPLFCSYLRSSEKPVQSFRCTNPSTAQQCSAFLFKGLSSSSCSIQLLIKSGWGTADWDVQFGWVCSSPHRHDRLLVAPLSTRKRLCPAWGSGGMMYACCNRQRRCKAARDSLRPGP